jgi:flagellar hook-basal body complex protein FliE
MAMRSAVLDRNAALRNVVASPTGVANTARVAGSTFEAAMNNVLHSDKSSAVSSVNGASGVVASNAAQQDGFASTIIAQVQKVNETGAKAGALTVAYERGETTDIAKVMLARQAASIGFEATLQVRNKLLSAYKDVMSMSV